MEAADLDGSRSDGGDGGWRSRFGWRRSGGAECLHTVVPAIAGARMEAIRLEISYGARKLAPGGRSAPEMPLWLSGRRVRLCGSSRADLVAQRQTRGGGARLGSEEFGARTWEKPSRAEVAAEISWQWAAGTRPGSG
ncbi:putative pollen-specific leucine-rich repeat extensin-like protein 3 [Iris pallida]|uniref:Pollen-specific leucine-rich repeat extensin-like protein 3 n=1 Tax=Iris pallida TaxID=29817 RepID=A0AAX6H6R7_IRIPA|nr:putative pollen-specific leucine-rich repeat extensin-like protein 3 [Iris pallida]